MGMAFFGEGSVFQVAFSSQWRYVGVSLHYKMEPTLTCSWVVSRFVLT